MTASQLLSSIKMSSVPPSKAFPLYDRLSIPKPKPKPKPKRSWVVKTENNPPLPPAKDSLAACPFYLKSNVWKEETKIPNLPCVGCGGKGKVNCRYCRGRGRTNCVHLAVLPKGEWPKWCKICGGSGIDYCLRCSGTGESTNSIGFQFPRKIDRGQNDQKKNP